MDKVTVAQPKQQRPKSAGKKKKKKTRRGGNQKIEHQPILVGSGMTGPNSVPDLQSSDADTKNRQTASFNVNTIPQSEKYYQTQIDQNRDSKMASS